MVCAWHGPVGAADAIDEVVLGYPSVDGFQLLQYPSPPACSGPSTELWTSDTNLSELAIGPGGSSCVAATQVAVSANNRHAMAVACDDNGGTLVMAIPSLAGTPGDSLFLNLVEGTPVGIESGDFTGDGLPDLLVVTDIGQVRSLHLLAQCSVADRCDDLGIAVSSR